MCLGDALLRARKKVTRRLVDVVVADAGAGILGTLRCRRTSRTPPCLDTRSSPVAQPTRASADLMFAEDLVFQRRASDLTRLMGQSALWIHWQHTLLSRD